MMDALIEFLRARLDEDEEIARAASGRREGQASDGEHWRWEYVHDDKPIDLDEADEIGVAFGVSLRSVELYSVYSGVGDLPHFVVQADEQEVRAARHIARHDPARVLAEVEAKRFLIAEILGYESEIDAEFGCQHNAQQIGAGECRRNPGRIMALRLMALPFDDHADYREDWRP